MAKYEVTTLSFIGNSLVEPGTVVEINDNPDKGGMRPGTNLKPYKARKGSDEADVLDEAGNEKK